MTLILSNENVEKLLTIENCMDALDYAYGELGRDNAVMGPVIRVISPVMAGQTYGQGRQLFYAYSSMAAACRAGMSPQTGRTLTCSSISRPRPACVSSEIPGFARRAFLRSGSAPQGLDRGAACRD